MKKESKRNMAEILLDAAEFSNFAQFFKMEMWKRLEGGFLPEKSLDEIAQLLWDYKRGYPR